MEGEKSVVGEIEDDASGIPDAYTTEAKAEAE